jgi:hypothetical protein
VSDNLGERLREGSSRFAADMTPAPAERIRARGDQRRKRNAAGSVFLAFVVLLAGGGAAYALGWADHTPSGNHVVASAPSVTPSAPHPVKSPSSGRTTTGASGDSASIAASSPPSGTKTLRVGQLILQVPDAWRITYSDSQGDYTVSTGDCAGDPLGGGQGGSSCAAFSLISDAGPTSGPAPTTKTYDLDASYTTSTGVTGCPDEPYEWLRVGTDKPYYSGYAPVTTSKTADYTVWQFSCRSVGGKSGAAFQQRDWYLPMSKILIVDEYSIPGLSEVLATGTWQ